MDNLKLGDKVWYASIKTIEKSVVCPECFGKKYLTVILGDDSQVTIDCAGCSKGCEPPRGVVFYWSSDINVSLVEIEKIEIRKDKVEYGFNGYCIANSDYIFTTKKEAEIKAKELSKEHNKKELERIYRKEKNNHTWAWNVHYHQRCIKACEKDLLYHKAKIEWIITK